MASGTVNRNAMSGSLMLFGHRMMYAIAGARSHFIVYFPSENLDLLLVRLGAGFAVSVGAVLVQVRGRGLDRAAFGDAGLQRAFGIRAHGPVEVTLQQGVGLVQKQRQRL